MSAPGRLVLATSLCAVALLAPRPCSADDLDRAWAALRLALAGLLVAVGALFVFVTLALVLRWRTRRSRLRGALGLAAATRVLVAAWFAAAVAPIVWHAATSGTHDLGYTVLYCLIGGAPAHLAALFCLRSAGRLLAAARV